MPITGLDKPVYEIVKYAFFKAFQLVFKSFKLYYNFRIYIINSNGYLMTESIRVSLNKNLGLSE